MIATLCVPISNSQVLYLCRLKVELQIYQKIDFFFSILKLVVKVLYQYRKHCCLFLLFTGLCVAKVSKCTELFAVIWASSALHPSHAPDSVGQTAVFGCRWTIWVCIWSQAESLGVEEPLPQWCDSSGVGCSMSCARQHTAHRPWVGCACSKAWVSCQSCDLSARCVVVFWEPFLHDVGIIPVATLEP